MKIYLFSINWRANRNFYVKCKRIALKEKWEHTTWNKMSLKLRHTTLLFIAKPKKNRTVWCVLHTLTVEWHSVGWRVVERWRRRQWQKPTFECFVFHPNGQISIQWNFSIRFMFSRFRSATCTFSGKHSTKYPFSDWRNGNICKWWSLHIRDGEKFFVSRRPVLTPPRSSLLLRKTQETFSRRVSVCRLVGFFSQKFHSCHLLTFTPSNRRELGWRK